MGRRRDRNERVGEKHLSMQADRLDLRFSDAHVDRAIEQALAEGLARGDLQMRLNVRVRLPVAHEEVRKKVDANGSAGAHRQAPALQSAQACQRVLRFGLQREEPAGVACQQLEDIGFGPVNVADRVGFSIGPRRFQGRSGAIHGFHRLAPGGQMQREAAGGSEAIERVALSVFCGGNVVLALVEIDSRFLSAQQVGAHRKAVDVHGR